MNNGRLHHEAAAVDGSDHFGDYDLDLCDDESNTGLSFNEERNTNEAVQRNLEAYYHLDEPLFVQYLFYLKSIVAFDFGPSIKQPSQSVNDMLSRGFPVSFELGMTSLIIAILSGIALGIFAALRQNGIIDYAAMTVAVLGISVPNFIMATMLIQQFAVNWNIFPFDMDEPDAYGAPDSCFGHGADGDYRQADAFEHD